MSKSGRLPDFFWQRGPLRELQVRKIEPCQAQDWERDLIERARKTGESLDELYENFLRRSATSSESPPHRPR